VVNPNNPTGHFLAEAELEALLELGLPIISDEVFATYPLEAPSGRVRSVVGARGGLVFALSGLSKLLALPQMKLAWIAVGGSEPEVTESLARLELIGDAYLSPNAMSLQALESWLSGRSEVQAQIRARLLENLAALSDAVAGKPVSRLPVEGGWYAALRFPATETDESWALGLLEHARVIVYPGYFFDFDRAPHAIVSLLPDPEGFREGVTRLVDYAARR
jgi:aspartate/methionine/tyrosine aminotransferase